MREQLAILVNTGKAKEAIRVNMTQDQVKRLKKKVLKGTTNGRDLRPL